MAKKNYVLDTSVFLTDADSIFKFSNNDIFVPLKVLEEMRRESRELLKRFKASEGDKKEQYKQAISLNITDRKFLLETMFTQPIEKDV